MKISLLNRIVHYKDTVSGDTLVGIITKARRKDDCPHGENCLNMTCHLVSIHVFRPDTEKPVSFVENVEASADQASPESGKWNWPPRE
jgi:hypothetical protein